MKMKDLRKFDKGQFLDLLGLQEQETGTYMALRALGLIATGALIGVGVGLALAPSSGREFRTDLSRRLKDGTDRLKNGTERIVSRAKDKLEEAELAGA